MKVHALPILATMVLGVMLLSGVVLAETKPCHNNCKGTNRPDHITGDGSRNRISGLGSTDYIGGKGASDTLFGGGGDDEVAGGSGADSMSGGRGVDIVRGKRGYDKLIGDPSERLTAQHSAFQVQGGRRLERLLGGRGNDIIRAQDGKKDIIRGGPGDDTAYVDPVDDVKGVEVKPGGVGNLPPIANGDTKTVDENANATTIDVLANDTDVDGGPKSIQSATDPDNGTVVVAADGSSLTYKPDEDYWNYECGKGAVKPPDDFNYTLNGGSTATVDVIVANLVSCNLG
jgi:Ca2+-binding RTX toxin-like protein